MNVVIATPIIYDKTSPFNHLFQDIIGSFLNKGYHVTRLVAVDDENNSDYTYGFDENITYKKYKRKNSAHNNIISRYVRDTLTSMRQALGILRLKNTDVLFEDVCYSSVWPVLAAKIKGIKVVAMLQDVWPDNAVQTNLIGNNSFLYKFFEFFQKIIYKKADKIICISDDMRDFIKNKGVSEDKINVIYNWGYSDETVNISWEDNLFVKKYNLSEDYFYAVYAGNIGKMQNVGLIAEAAEILKDNEKIRFLIIGDGAMRDEIEKSVSGMENVTMLPFQPQELAVHIYSMANVNIIPLVPGGLKTALPSKFGVCFSCGNPIIACVDNGTKLEEMFLKYGCGTVTGKIDAQTLANCISEQSEIKYEKNYECFNDLFKRSENTAKYAECLKF